MCARAHAHTHREKIDLTRPNQGTFSLFPIFCHYKQCGNGHPHIYVISYVYEHCCCVKGFNRTWIICMSTSLNTTLRNSITHSIITILNSKQCHIWRCFSLFHLKGQREGISVPCCYWWREMLLFSLVRKYNFKNIFLKNLLRGPALNDKTTEGPSPANGGAALCSLLKWAWNQTLFAECFLASAMILCHLNFLTHSTGPSIKS